MNELTLGIKISTLRKQNNLTQSDLADLLGVSSQAVSKWEMGQSMPDIVTLCKIAEQLDQDLNYFARELEEKDLLNDDESLDNPTLHSIRSLQDRPSNQKINSTQDTIHHYNGHHNDDTTTHNGQGGNQQSQSERPHSNKVFDMAYATWKNNDFSGLKNPNGKFGYAIINGCKFNNADLTSAKFTANVIKDSTFDNANLQGASIVAASVSKSSFIHCNMSSANIKASDIKDCQFNQSKLDNASIKASQITKCDFEQISWNGLELKNTKLKQLTISGSITDASFVGVWLKDIQFKNCSFQNTLFKNIKFASVQFLDCTVDNTTYSFLQNCKGVDFNGITKI